MADNITLPTGETIATGEINSSHYQKFMDFEDIVALGLVPGWSTISAMGERETMTVVTGGEDICRMNELNPASSDTESLLTPGSGGVSLSIYCEDADDAAGGIGVQEVTIDYIDTSYAEQTVVVATNGTTAVSTGVTDAVFVNDMYATSMGSNKTAVGNIHCFESGTTSSIFNFIIAGGNKSLVPHRMCPDGCQLLIKGWHCEETNSDRIFYKIRSTDVNGVLNTGIFTFIDSHNCKNSASGWLPLNHVVPARSIIKVSGWALTANAIGNCGWRGFKVAL